MRILLVSFIADARWTGMGRWTSAVKTALEQQGFTVDAWFADRFPRTYALGRFAVLAFPVVLALQLIKRRRDYDAVILHEPTGFWYGLARRFMTNLPPMIAMCHNVERHYYETMLRYIRLGLARIEPLTRLRAPLLRHWQSNGAIRLADHVLCLSSIDRTYITRTLRVPQSGVTLVINGVGPEASATAAHPGAGRRVVWVGGWLDVKGRFVLPRLWRGVRDRLPEATLTLIGTGADPAAVLPGFDPQDRESITVIPRVESADRMREMYASGNAYLLTSLSEGSPLSLLEAMAAGLPTVATNVGGVPDIATDRVHALLFAPEEPGAGARALCEVLENPALAGKLATAARARAHELTWERTAEGIARVLRSTAAPVRQA